jgi:hypothetical protein
VTSSPRQANLLERKKEEEAEEEGGKNPQNKVIPHVYLGHVWQNSSFRKSVDFLELGICSSKNL